jgi:hypothetical protein
MASRVDGDVEECIETWRLTGTQSDVIQYNPIQFNILYRYKVHDFYTNFQMPSGDGL